MKKILIAGALMVSSATTAHAQNRDAATDPANRADLQCLAVVSASAGMQEADSEARMGLVAGVGYYLGRLEGRAPGGDWLDRLGDYLAGDFEAEFKAQSQRCGEEMMAFGAELTVWGGRMEALAAKKDNGKK